LPRDEKGGGGTVCAPAKNLTRGKWGATKPSLGRNRPHLVACCVLGGGGELYKVIRGENRGEEKGRFWGSMWGRRNSVDCVVCLEGEENHAVKGFKGEKGLSKIWSSGWRIRPKT